MCVLSKIILTDSNLFFYLYAFLGNPQLLIITLINIPENIGRLTNIRAATAYEEYLPFVQNKIVKKIFEKIK